MIMGLQYTRGDRGQMTSIQRLTVAWKAVIGKPADGKSNYPSKLDHFRIVKKNIEGDWVDDEALTKALEEQYAKDFIDKDGNARRGKLREFDVVFMNDAIKVENPDGDGTFYWNIESVFRTEYAWWTATEKKCSGNGEAAQRKVSALPEKERAQHGDAKTIPWKPCGENCPELDKGLCKPNGALSFLFKDNPIVGSIAQYKTTSYESIARIHSSLIQILDLTGGRLKGIPLKLVLRPGKTRYTDKEGKLKTGNAFFVNVEFREADYRRLVPELMAQSVQYIREVNKNARLLTEHVDDDLDPTEESREAADMTSEFYPDNRDPEQPAAPAVAQQAATIDKDFEQACGVHDIQGALRDTMVKQFKGDIGEATAWLNRFNALVKERNIAPGRAKDLFSQALLTPNALEHILVAAPAPEKKTTRKAAPPKPAAAEPAPQATAEPAVTTATPEPAGTVTEEPLPAFDF